MCFYLFLYSSSLILGCWDLGVGTIQRNFSIEFVIGCLLNMYVCILVLLINS